MEQMKFDVTNKPGLSAIIQQMLFELGCSWRTKGCHTDYTEESQLTVLTDGDITCSNTYNPETDKEFKFTTLEELAAKLQEHYQKKDTVNVGDVVEVELLPDDIQEFKFQVLVEADTSNLRTVSLYTGLLWSSYSELRGESVSKQEFEEYTRRKIIRNLGPLKDLVSVS